MKIKDILARLAKPVAHDEVREIESILAKLDADVAAAKATLAGLAEKRVAALKADDDKALDGIDVAKLTADRLIEKAALARPQIETRLEAARKAAREAARDVFKARQIELAGKLAAALRTAEALNKEAEELDNELRASLGEHSGLSGITFGGTLLHGGPATWHSFVESSFGHLPPPPPSAPYVKTKQEKAKPEPTPARPKPKKPKRILPDIPAEGHVRVTAIRKGYESPNGFPLDVGDEIDLPWEMAQKAVMSGACDYSGELVAQ